ncbi:MAG: DNA-binding protein [Desulfurococcales archaeon ex4484_58]|nr:MAG: DNA-binding protein [Desulfurococcales archaeon ex4484_58]
MNGIYPDILRERAWAMFRLANRLFERGEYDLSAMNIEYAVQLYLKSLLYRVSGEEWRGYNIRSLLGSLILLLQEQGFDREASKITSFIRRNRRVLAELEEAHTRVVYSVFSYSRDQVKILLGIARELMDLLKNIEEKVFSNGFREDYKA